MSLFEEPHLEPQPEPEKPKKKKLLSIGIGAALIVAVLVTSVVAFSFGQSGKPADNVPDPPQLEEVQTPSDTDTPSDESTDTEKPEDTTPFDSAQETPSTSGKQEIDPSTGKDKYQTDRYRMESPHLRSRKMPKSIHRRNIPARSPLPAKRSLTTWTR